MGLTERCTACGGPVWIRSTGEPGTEDELLELRALPDTLEGIEAEVKAEIKRLEGSFGYRNTPGLDIHSIARGNVCSPAVRRLFNGCEACGREPRVQ